MDAEKLIFYNVSNSYIDFLRENGDEKVMFNKPDKRTRPYVGFVLTINNTSYLVPLSSVIRKTNDVTMVIPNTFTEAQRLENKIEKKYPENIAVIKFNCMIPVFPEVIEKIDLDKIPNDKAGEDYKSLLVKEILFCSQNRERILKKAHRTYEIYGQNKPYMKEIIDSCCNFPLLEEKCKEYQFLVEETVEYQKQAAPGGKENIHTEI